MSGDIKTSVSDIVFVNGYVYTADRRNPWAEAVAVEGGDIIFVGPNGGSKNLIGSETKVVDLNGKMLLPGFHDAHCHPDQGGVMFTTYCGLFGLSKREKIFSRIREFTEKIPGDEWVLGTGWSLDAFQDMNPIKEDLDAVTAGHPAYMIAEDWHNIWLNSKALSIMGIDKSTPDPHGGIIERNAETGEPSGTLRESAIFLAQEFIPKEDLATQAKGLKAAMKEANRFGIVSLLDAWCVDPIKEEAYKSLENDGELTTRINLTLLVDERWNEDIDSLLNRRILNNEMLISNQVKLMVDGVMESQTAALKKAYIGTKGKKGILYYSDEQLLKWIPLFESNGFQTHAHTMGDAAIAQVLDGLERSREINQKPNNRPCFIHNYLVDPADYPRLKKCNASTCFTMLWRQQNETMLTLNKPYLEEEQYINLMPMKQLADYGILVTGGSDWPVSNISPLASIQIALTGGALPFHIDGDYTPDQPNMPGERPLLSTLINAYTINAAYANSIENFTGSIEKGKRADFVVLEENLFTISKGQIEQTKVLMTMLNGQVVYGDLGNC